MNLQDLPDMSDALKKVQQFDEKKKLDPVGKEDGDVDNDGDKDSSDEYLMKRRKAISKAMKKEAYTVTNADKKGNTPAYQNFKKGMKGKDGKPLYKAADHMKESGMSDEEIERIERISQEFDDAMEEGYKGTADLSKSHPEAVKKLEKNIEKFAGKRVPGGKMGVKEDLAQEGSAYGLTKGTGKPGGAMKAYLDNKAKKLEAEKKKQRPEYRNNPAFGDPSHHSNAKNK
tara:strand:- start:125 stop:811 length:687 start_codon:yes stop_codon:yes gene_type:complete